MLNLSVEKNLKVKMALFTRELGGSVPEIRDVVVGTPTVLGYSLTKRILPRLQVMRSMGVEASFAEHRWHLTSYTTLQFRKFLENHVIQATGALGRGDDRVRTRMRDVAAFLKKVA